MNLCGLDIATTTGIACLHDGVVTASSFKPKAKRPFGLKAGEVDYLHEGRVAREFRDHLRAVLVAEEIEAVAIEQPLRSNITIRKPVVNRQASFSGQAITYEEKGGTNFGTIFRIYTLAGAACELCARLGISVQTVNQAEWRKAFLGSGNAPRGTENASEWHKKRALVHCTRLGISVPNADAAESVGVLYWLIAQKMPGQRAGDLFAGASA